MTALSRFFEDGFAVHGAFWSGVGEDERRAFLMGVKFPYVETRFANEADAAEYYDLMNFGGVAHAEGDRAVPSPAR